MDLQKNINIFENKKHNHNKKFRILRFLISSYSNCRLIYGDFDDKENIN